MLAAASYVSFTMSLDRVIFSRASFSFMLLCTVMCCTGLGRGSSRLNHAAQGRSGLDHHGLSRRTLCLHKCEIAYQRISPSTSLLLSGV